MKTFKQITAQKTPSLVVFIHSGHQDVIEIKNNINELRKKYADKVNILRVDSSYDHRLGREFNLSAFPTYVLMKEGQELMRESGRKSVAQLSQMIERAF